ncbi:hypothetical protein [Maricaulis sp. CAU 1757]
MTVIQRAYIVPTPTSRRIAPTVGAHGSNDREPQQDRARPSVPTRKPADRSREQGYARARPATAEVIVQIIAGPQRRGLKADASEQARYRRTYEQASEQKAPPPQWERRA